MGMSLWFKIFWISGLLLGFRMNYNWALLCGPVSMMWLGWIINITREGIIGGWRAVEFYFKHCWKFQQSSSQHFYSDVKSFGLDNQIISFLLFLQSFTSLSKTYPVVGLWVNDIPSSMYFLSKEFLVMLFCEDRQLDNQARYLDIHFFPILLCLSDLTALSQLPSIGKL